MRALSVLAFVAASLAAAPTLADDKDKKELTGTYTRQADQMDLKVVFKKDKMVEFHVTIGEVGCVMTAKYTRDKEGTVMAEVTEFEKKGDFPVVKEKGYRFSFKWEPGDKKAKLTELTGDDIADEQKQAVEGEYTAKTD
jgi:hypothetical protein